VIVLDASVVLAVLDAQEGHYHVAHRVLRECIAAGETLGCSPITLAEALVRPVSSGRLIETEGVLHLLGIATIALPADAAPRLALLRVESGMKMPDCCVLLAATQSEGAVITFDDALAKAAGRLGLRVISG
jgi:predicted nucleic acid-binding protein